MARGELSLREALAVSRPSWWLVTAVPFVAGSLLAEDKLSLALIVGAFYFLIPYNLLLHGVSSMFDSEQPKIKHPSLWRWIIAANAPFLLYFVFAGNIEATVFLIMMIYLVFAYSAPGLRYKEIPLIDSLTSAFHHASPFLFALFLFESPNLWAPIFAGIYFWAVGNHAYRHGKKKIFYMLAYALAIIAPVLAYVI